MLSLVVALTLSQITPLPVPPESVKVLDLLDKAVVTAGYARTGIDAPVTRVVGAMLSVDSIKKSLGSAKNAALCFALIGAENVIKAMLAKGHGSTPTPLVIGNISSATFKIQDLKAMYCNNTPGGSAGAVTMSNWSTVFIGAVGTNLLPGQRRCIDDLRGDTSSLKFQPSSMSTGAYALGRGVSSIEPSVPLTSTEIAGAVALGLAVGLCPALELPAAFKYLTMVVP